MPKSAWLTEALHEYLVAHSDPDDDLLRELTAETKRSVEGLWLMEIAPEQGAFMQMLVAISGARRAVEVGTFTGHSSISIARGLPDDGRLLCLDTSEEWTAIARRYWAKAGLEHKIELRLGPAVDALRALPREPLFDFAFIDADKPNYPVYYEEILARMPQGGLVVCDNVLWMGAVVDPAAQDEQTKAIRAFNDLVAADARVSTSMIPVGDGLLLARKR
ncbi:MAG: class I SAM-dependent methyltransferase [Myxococcota bacterium]|nr:class I SAM-dependent methyltransferase [Myxococcales bacterium]